MQLLAYLPMSSTETVSEILESMRQWEQGEQDSYYNERRQASRHPYDGWVTIVAPVDPDLRLFNVPTNVCAFLRGRNVSKSGISVVASLVLEPASITDFTPLLRVDQLLHVDRLCSVGLAPSKGLDMTWISSEVVRSHTAETDLVELGLQFKERLHSDCPVYEDAEQLFWRLRDSNSYSRAVARLQR